MALLELVFRNTVPSFSLFFSSHFYSPQINNDYNVVFQPFYSQCKIQYLFSFHFSIFISFLFLASWEQWMMNCNPRSYRLSNFWCNDFVNIFLLTLKLRYIVNFVCSFLFFPFIKLHTLRKFCSFLLSLFVNLFCYLLTEAFHLLTLVSF